MACARRTLVSVLAVLLAARAAWAAPQPDDVRGAPYASAVYRLVAAGVLRGYPDGTFRPHSPVTRAELAAIVARLRPGEAPYAAPRFYDVPPQHWAYRHIQRAAALGLMQGYTDGRFVPDGQVTEPEAITVLVRLMGYAEDARLSGPWPEGYYAVARKVGLLVPSPARPSGIISRGHLAVLLDRALRR